MVWGARIEPLLIKKHMEGPHTFPVEPGHLGPRVPTKECVFHNSCGFALLTDHGSVSSISLVFG